ncbi:MULTISPECIES: FAD-binding oxidoreductase [unclassified Flavobacterium]|uniref:NAD(P)/FAD-dependent oxidoreductase n=1 Tax=unclassified Flavobacterium TaxID=196869 RepID=UPI001F12F8D8|nr:MULTISPECIES: FAD-dependent oxidoreductase [unclassified Flavobacterium]UMY66849.1 FAD-binding oxidoreductase [Flavobacterium sp. HJ-32-4]
MKDVFIIGGGLAGVAMAEQLRRRDLSFLLFDDGSQRASWVAGGLYNPVILKRISAAWGAEDGMDRLSSYHDIETRIGAKVVHPLPVLRRFASVEEQNNWFAAMDRPVLSRFLSPKLRNDTFEGLSAPYGYGQVLETGYVNTATLLDGYRTTLKDAGALAADTFAYGDLIVSEGHVSYKGTEARHIVFAEGFGLQHNPYFSWLPLDGTKGELLVVKAPKLGLTKAIVKANVFVLPLGDDLFKIGATYAPWDKTPEPTESGRNRLEEEARALLTCDFEVVSHLAGIRPTVKDRRPLIGTHPALSNIHVLNGLGSRGVMLAPWMAECLSNHIFDQSPIPAECDIRRFMPLYSSDALS